MITSSIQLSSSTNQKTDEKPSVSPEQLGGNSPSDLCRILKAFGFLSYFLPASFCLCLVLASGKLGVGLIVSLMFVMVHFYHKPDPEPKDVQKSFIADMIRLTWCNIKVIKPTWRLLHLFDPLDLENLEDNLEKFKDNPDFKKFKQLCNECEVSRQSSLTLYAIKLLLLSLYVYGCSITACVCLATASYFCFTSFKVQLDKFDEDRRQAETANGALEAATAKY